MTQRTSPKTRIQRRSEQHRHDRSEAARNRHSDLARPSHNAHRNVLDGCPRSAGQGHLYRSCLGTPATRAVRHSFARESTHNYGPNGSARSRHLDPPEHQLFRLITRIHPDGGNLATRAFPRPVQAGSAISPRFHKRSRHGQGTNQEDHTTEIASEQVFRGADDGNRTRVFNLGSFRPVGVRRAVTRGNVPKLPVDRLVVQQSCNYFEPCLPTIPR
jgi:hypothetical protein